jgi:predicted tellurium resistance membrane protein TerC
VSYFDVMFRPEGLVSLVSLTVMEIVLGIDNIIFIAILSDKVGHGQGARVRRLGLALALIMRIGLLLALSWLMGLTAPLFSVLGQAFSGRDLVLLAGGLFLMAKATHELYEKVEGGDGEEGRAPGEGGKDQPSSAGPRTAGFGVTLAQILALDIVFSLDSVITAVGMVPHIPIMITAMVLAVIVMMIFANAVSSFISRHPSMKVLALSFLLLIGVLLVADAFDKHINKGYVYFAMAFSLGVEVINLRVRKLARRRKKVVPASSSATSSAATP